MRVSTRYLPAIVAMALVSIAVTWKGWLDPQLSDPCRLPAQMRALDQLPGTSVEPEDLARLSSETMQWSEARVPNPELPEMPMEAILLRSFSAPVFRKPPTEFLSKRQESGGVDLERVDEAGYQLPIHIIYETAQQPSRVVAYLYIHGNRPVESPFFASLRSSLQQIRNGRLPLTVLVIGGQAPRRSLEAVRKREVRWIEDGWRLYRRSCIEGMPAETGASGKGVR